MATFLTTPKMNPELAARVEASVTGRDPSTKSTQRVRRVVSVARFVLLLTFGYAIYFVVTTRRENKRDLEDARAALLDKVAAQTKTVTDDDAHAVARVEALILRASGPYEGDLVDADVRARGLAAVLARPSVYIRATNDALRSPSLIASAAAASAKDPLLLCLVEAPSARTEAALFEKVRVSYAGGAPMETRTANVRRLADAVAGMPFLLPPWAESVRAATDRAEIGRMQQSFDRAPIEHAKAAAKAEILVLAIDEPGDGRGPTELDGERPHVIRVVVVDIAKDRAIVRARHPVDPSWISPARRPTYSRGLDACAVGFDVHEDVRGTKTKSSL